VASAGDVNADGYRDYVVGAPGNDAVGVDAGRAVVVFGGPENDDVVDLVLDGAAAGDAFGFAIDETGDMSGDGYGDLVIGAPGSHGAGDRTGQVQLFHGGPYADAAADLIVLGEVVGDEFGYSVASAGDVNRDGYCDLVVGAPGSDAAGIDSGSAYVFFGGPGADESADLILRGEAAEDRFGAAVASTDDINGDGYADVIVGAPGNDATRTDAGRAYVFHGGAPADAEPDLILSGEGSGDAFGACLAPAGDINADGSADFAVGAPFCDVGAPDAGRAYVFFGGPAVDASHDWAADGEAANDGFGYSIGPAGDTNRDGYDDIVIGAPGNDARGTDAGRAYVFYGGPALSAMPGMLFSGETADDQFGISVATAGDTNSDGFADVIVGAHANDVGGDAAGRAYVYDVNRYHLLAPNGGDSWDVGAVRTISWHGSEPANLWLSVDGGATYDLIANGVGGETSNAIPLLVPHQPTRYARVKVTPTVPSIFGSDQSDQLFTIDAWIDLLRFRVEPPAENEVGAFISWETNPGPEDLDGYQLERSMNDGSNRGSWDALVTTRETSYHDRDAGPGATYRLTAVNGLGEAYLLGEVAYRPATLLVASPLPFRSGETLTIRFAAVGGPGGGVGPAAVGLYDIGGRLVRDIANSAYPAGVHELTWDGRDRSGRSVAAGVYFLRVVAGGRVEAMKVTVIQ